MSSVCLTKRYGHLFFLLTISAVALGGMGCGKQAQQSQHPQPKLTLRQEKSEAGTDYSMSAVAFSSDGKMLASGAASMSPSGKNLVTLWNVETGSRLWEVDVETFTNKQTNYSTVPNTLAFSPDGKTLASGSEECVALLDVKTGALKRTFDQEEIQDIKRQRFSISPDGKTIAICGDEHIILLDMETGAMKSDLSKWGVFVNFSPDGKTLACDAAWDSNKTSLVDVETG